MTKKSAAAVFINISISLGNDKINNFIILKFINKF